MEKSTLHHLRNALLTGLVPSIFEGVLVYSVEPTINHWVLLQSILAWFSFGFVNYLVTVGSSKIVSSICLTVLLNVPWFIAESVVKNKPEHFIPLLIASVVMGAIIGFVSRWLDK